MAKPRIIISSDIGGSDNDDMESMAHALINADKFDIEAIISTPTKHDGRVSDIYKALDAYTKDYNNLKTWGDYPTPDSLKSVVYQGSINVPGPSGYGSPTAASKAIIKAAHAGSDPVYVLCWGAMTDVAQALHDDPSIAGNIRILASNGWNGTQDPYSRNYVYNNFKDVWWIEDKSTHRGIYINSSGNEGNSFNMNNAKGHGALGDYFYNARPYGVKMGDSWSITYLLDQADNNNPGANSWGGTFVKTGHGPNYWTDDTNPAHKVGAYNGAGYMRAHQGDIYDQMYKMFDRAKSPNSGSGPTNTDKPVTAANDTASTQKDKAVVVKVLANDSAPDGGLKIASADTASANGGKVVVNSDGTVTYTPKTGYTGSDTFKYTAKDADGDTKLATVTVNVKTDATHPSDNGGSTGGSTGGTGTGHGVTAGDDKYTMDAGKKLYFNTNHILLNDKGADGGLKASVASTSANGVTLEKWNDGTIVYKAGTASGTDKIDYVLTDKDGSKDVGSVLITIKNGVVSSTKSQSSSDNVAKSGDSSSNHPSTSQAGNVHATPDNYKVDGGETLYFNSRYLTTNDKGASLAVASVDAVSERGVKVSWGAEGTDKDGTFIYKAQTGFDGVDKVNYKIVDGKGGHDIGTILIHVHDIA